MLRNGKVLALCSILAVGVTIVSVARATQAGNPSAAKQQHRIREASRAQLQYRPLFKELGLTPEQRAQFVDVIAAERTQGDETDMGDNWRRINGDFSTSQDTMRRISEIVGADRISAFEQYEREFREQIRVSNIGEEFEASSAPLSTEQAKRLVQIFVTERARVPAPVAALQTFEALESYLNWQTEYDQRVLESSGSILTARQLDLLEERFEAQAMKRQLALEKQRNGSTLGFLWFPPES